MAGRLEGKVAIVTGAGSSGPGVGNGKAASILFAREGASVLLVDMELERAQETLALIETEGGTASAAVADVTNAADCEAMVNAAVQRYGRVDILHNNVGISTRADVIEVTEAQWDHIMAVNVKSVGLTSRYAIPRMTETGGGSIINISSIAGLRAHSNTLYSASKAAVIGLTISMAADHGRDNIRVNCIAPGLVYTPMAVAVTDVDDEIREQRKKVAPLGTEGTAWDVASAALYLASDEARWVTGTVLPVDGGLLAVTPATYSPVAPQRHHLPSS